MRGRFGVVAAAVVLVLVLVLVLLAAGGAAARPAERVRTHAVAETERRGVTIFVGVAGATVDDPAGDGTGTGIDAVIFVEQGNGAPKAVRCPFIHVERGSAETSVDAFCSVGKAARGARASLDVNSCAYDGADTEFLDFCTDERRLRGQYREFSCTVANAPAE